MDFDLNLLFCFKVVAENSSISKAAKILCLTQPAVSAQIKKLETQLKIQLFQRHNRGLVLTKPGKHLYCEVKKWESMFNEMLETTKNLHNDIRGVIHIGTYSTISSHLLPEKIKTFLKKFPQISFSFNYGTTEDLLRRVVHHELDCAILCDIEAHSDLQQVMFFQDEMLLVANKSLKYHMKKPNDWHMLSYPHRLEPCFQQVQKQYKSLWKKAHTIIESENFETLKQCLVQGLGAAFMPRYIITDRLNTLQKLKIKKKIPIKFFFITPASYERRSVVAFRDHLLQEF